MATCKGCGKPVIWGIDYKGARIPLDPTPPVYALLTPLERPGGDRRIELVPLEGEGEMRGRRAMVSHFVTCPQRAQFSGQSRARKTQEEAR